MCIRDRIYGLHNMPGMKAGTIATRVGVIMASEDNFIIHIKEMCIRDRLDNDRHFLHRILHRHDGPERLDISRGKKEFTG